MQLLQDQIDKFGYTESQIQHINSLINLAFVKGENKGINHMIEINNSFKSK